MHTHRLSLTRLLQIGLAFAGSLIAASVAHAQAQFAGTYIGTINIKVSVPVAGYSTESTSGFYSVVVSSSGAVDLSTGTLTGTVNSSGVISFTGGSALASLGITSGKITGTQLTSEYGNVVGNGTTQFKLNGSTAFTALAGTGGTGGGGGGTGGTVTAYANGSFEGGPNPGASWITLSAGSTVINNWTVTSGTVDYMGTAWAASNGTRSIDMSGISAGAIAQTFVTTQATTYTVTFDFAGNPGYGTGTGVKKMRVSVNNAGAAAQDYTFDTTGKTLANMGWTTQTFTFVATGTSTTLTFTSQENSAYGPAIDNVRINGSTGDTGTGATTSITTTVSGTTATVAPANLTSYRNKVGATYEFTVTGTTSGAVWGTDVYTDDSSVAAAAVHAGVIVPGQTKVLTISILAGQNSYTASTRNGVSTSSWGAWTGSYSFAGSTSSIGTTTTVPQLSVSAASINIARTLAFGSPYVLSIPISGVGPFTYQWFLNGVLISGATSASYSIPSLTAANSGTYSLRVTNVAGANTFQAGSISVQGAAGTPVINLQPLNKVVSPGGTFALATNATGAGLSYQWFRNNVSLSGETGSIILRNSANAGDAGNYTVRVTNSSGSITSNAGVVTLDPNASVISNISVRVAATAGQIVTPGFTIAGTGKKRLLIRAVGPKLADFNIPVADVMADPKLTVFEGSTAIPGLANDNWDASLASVFASVGAFGLNVGSKDAAMVVELDASASGRGYTVQVTGVNNSAGVVLLEVYDLGNVTGGSKLTNVSVLTQAGKGSSTLILGLVLRGSGQRTLLVRGVGPTLAAAPFNIGGTLVDPKITIVDSNQRSILTNNDWGQADYLSELSLASNFVGAFALVDQSKDAATLSLLDASPSGTSYTVPIVGQDDGTGLALIEVYEVP